MKRLAKYVSATLIITLYVALTSCGGGPGATSSDPPPPDPPPPDLPPPDPPPPDPPPPDPPPPGGSGTGGQDPEVGPELVVANSRGNAGITAFGNSAHLIYEENSIIYYRRSMDEGATWSPQVTEHGRQLASRATPYLIDPLINDGINLYLFYVRINENIADFLMPINGSIRPVGDLYVMVSPDGGTTWTSEIPLTDSGKAFRLSATAPSPGVVHLAWMDFEPGDFAPMGEYGTWNIKYIKTTDSFQSFSKLTLLEGTGSFGVERPSVKAIGDSVYLTWMQERVGYSSCPFTETGLLLPSCPGTSFMRSIDGGENWTIPVDISPAANNYASRGTISASRAPNGSEDILVIAYDEFQDTASNYGLDIRAVVSTDSGLSWSTASADRLSESYGDSTHAHVNGSDGEFHISWHDVRPSGGTQVLWSFLSEPYEDWSNPIVLSAEIGDTPLLASSSNYFHALWQGANTTSYRRIAKNSE